MLEILMERLGEPGLLATGALLIGAVFGFMAQRSRFCLRSAVIEFARRQPGGKLTVWLFAFATAVGATQALAWAGWFDAGNARQIAARGSLSGALVGGALFGIGMVLAGFDKRLWAQDLAGSRAHARMLISQGVIASSDGEEILEGLARIEDELLTGTFPFRDEYEDIHMNIEARLRELIGPT